MRCLSFLFVLTAITASDTVHGDAVGYLVSEVEPVLVEIKPLSAARRYVARQDLEFTLIVEPLCPADMRIGSVSVTAADTRMTFSGSEFDEQAQVKTTLIIPRRQVVAIAIDDYCRQGETASTLKYDLQIDAAYTASLSLRCISDEKQSIIYLAQPLGVILSCVDGDNAESAVDQGTAATSTTR